MTLQERLDGMTIGSAIATRATTDPTGVYLVDGGSTLTFAEVDAQAEALAARLLGINRSTLYAKLKEHGIDGKAQ